MAIRRTVLGLFVLSALLGGQAACSESTRYRVLTFFFDDVPLPGAAPVLGYPGRLSVDGTPMDEARARATALAENRAHPPYREHRCGRCHDFATGEVWRSAREGLCASCHEGVTTAHRYMHGPVAIQDCLVCHHHHGSSYPHLLVGDPLKICQKCHQREKLISCAHLDGDETRSCLDCHTGHGGDNLYFLKPGES